MSGERLPSPDLQVREALEAARSAGMTFVEAWELAVSGHLCDDYRSARGETPDPAVAAGGPPNLRASTAEQRCAGCRYGERPQAGLGHCGLYDVPVYAGVLWPHRTDDRREWKNAIRSARDEWQRAYEGRPSRVAAILTAIRARIVEAETRDPRLEHGRVTA